MTAGEGHGCFPERKQRPDTGDNDLVRRLVASIKVISADRIQIQFQSGIVMEQEIGNE